uniref:Uncharacterized protein n=1 Tax=Cairina moschata TaxID=8855 RepID=A0A8C3BEY4_CAIMO
MATECAEPLGKVSALGYLYCLMSATRKTHSAQPNQLTEWARCPDAKCSSCLQLHFKFLLVCQLARFHMDHHIIMFWGPSLVTLVGSKRLAPLGNTYTMTSEELQNP